MKTPPIYVVNPDALDGCFAGFTACQEADAEIERVYRKHVYKGLDPMALDFLSGVEIAPGIEISSIDIAFKNPAHKAAYDRALVNEMRPAVVTERSTPDYRAVKDWVAEAHIHSPKIYAAILDRKLTFAAMVEHSKRWHEAKVRRLEKLKDRIIPRDDVEAPTVLELTGKYRGWRWVWLKTNRARDLEGRMMGHCVGDGGYDGIDDDEGIFSLRDDDQVPHVTVFLYKKNVRQASCRGNPRPTGVLEELVELLRLNVGVRLSLFGDPTQVLSDGPHIVTVEGCTRELHFKNGLLHRADGPAHINPTWVTYYIEGKRIRRMDIEKDEAIYQDGKGNRTNIDGTPWADPRAQREMPWAPDVDSGKYVTIGELIDRCRADGRHELADKLMRKFEDWNADTRGLFTNESFFRTKVLDPDVPQPPRAFIGSLLGRPLA